MQLHWYMVPSLAVLAGIAGMILYLIQAWLKKGNRKEIMMLKRMIHVNTQFEGIHNWPDAPTIVAFLQKPHRHIFYVTATLPVTHDDRQLEFFMVKQEIDAFIADRFVKGQLIAKLHSTSCESIATQILHHLMSLFELISGEVTVMEDDENGATVREEVPAIPFGSL